MWPFDPPPPADEPDAWYEDVGDAIYDVATAPENAIYFGLFLLAVTLTVTIVCVFRGWSRSHPPPEAPPPLSPKRPASRPPGAPGEPRSSHVVHKKSVQHAKAVEVGDPEQMPSGGDFANPESDRPNVKAIEDKMISFFGNKVVEIQCKRENW